MKKAVSLVISLLLIIGIVPISASAETTSITQDGIEYLINTETGEAEVYYAYSGIVTADIPSEINGYPVTSIGNFAFFNCTSLTEVTIGGSVTSIGEYAFSDCKSLTAVTIGDSVT
ncbi:MAG: leucine-rich repeat protein, partial [Acutalibacteraceae bacterium]|nr:leucine-rich repeat protein [Acutalibacteraceae bacterium]